MPVTSVQHAGAKRNGKSTASSTDSWATPEEKAPLKVEEARHQFLADISGARCYPQATTSVFCCIHNTIVGSEARLQEAETATAVTIARDVLENIEVLALGRENDKLEMCNRLLLDRKLEVRRPPERSPKHPQRSAGDEGS